MQLLSALPSQSPLSFRKWKFLAPSLKKLLFLGKPLGFFITISSGAFISPLIFTIVSGCFHFTNFRVFHHCFCRYFYFTTDFYYCFLSVFISPILFTITVFCQVRCTFCLAVPWFLRIWISFFYSLKFFTLHSIPTFSTTCNYEGFLGSCQFYLESCRPPTDVQNTDLTHLFIWITQYSQQKY